MKGVLARALRALAVAPLNCSLILDAGGLEPLIDMLAGGSTELAHQAVAVMSLLTKVPVHLNTSALCLQRVIGVRRGCCQLQWVVVCED